MIIYTLIETDLQDNEYTILGNFSTPEKAHNWMIKYYGNKCESIEYNDIRDSRIEWQKIITMVDYGVLLGGKSKYKLDLYRFCIDEEL